MVLSTIARGDYLKQKVNVKQKSKVVRWHLRDVKLEELHSQTLTEALHGKLGSRVDVVENHACQVLDDRQEFSRVSVSAHAPDDLNYHLNSSFPCPPTCLWPVITSGIRQAQCDRPVV